MKLFNKEEFRDFKKFLKNNNIPYDLEQSGRSFTLRSRVGDCKYLMAKLPPHQLGFINRVKNHIKKVIKGKRNFWKNKNIQNDATFKIKYSEDGKTNIAYSRCADKLEVGKEFNNIYEIDIKSAYWTVANRWGLLTRELFLEGKRRKKMLRLIALGSLAKRKYKFKYIPKEKKQVLKSIKFNKTTKKVWDNICGVVGKSILDVKDNLPTKDFIFFWVDGIYFKGEHNIEKVLKTFLKHGFRCKVKKIYKIKIEVDTEYKTYANTIKVYETKTQFKNRNDKTKDKKERGRPFFISKEAFNEFV